MKVFKIGGTIYPLDLIVSIGGSLENAQKELKDFGVKEDLILDILSLTEGRTTID